MAAWCSRPTAVEARVGWAPVKGVELAAGCYRGTRAQAAGSKPHMHTAQRWNVMASWVGERGHAAEQYFRAGDWTRITRPGSDDQRGGSAWSSYQFTPQYGVFARYDETRMSLDIDPITRERYHQLGVEWKPNRRLRLAAVGKRVEQRSAKKAMESNEVGVWAQLAF